MSLILRLLIVAAGMGIEAGRGSPADFAAMVAADSARWGRLAKERNIKLD